MSLKDADTASAIWGIAGSTIRTRSMSNPVDVPSLLSIYSPGHTALAFQAIFWTGRFWWQRRFQPGTIATVYSCGRRRRRGEYLGAPAVLIYPQDGGSLVKRGVRPVPGGPPARTGRPAWALGPDLAIACNQPAVWRRRTPCCMPRYMASGGVQFSRARTRSTRSLMNGSSSGLGST